FRTTPIFILIEDSQMAKKKAKLVDRQSDQTDSWLHDIPQFSNGTKLDECLFREQQFLDWSVLKAALLRDYELKVMTKDANNNQRIVKDVDDSNIITLKGEDDEITIRDIVTNYKEAEKLIGGEELREIVFLDELSNKSTKEVRKLLEVAQYFLYNPPGDSQWLAVLVKNHDSVLECLLFMGEISEEKFVLSNENPWRRTLVMGSVGMSPLYRLFEIDNDEKSRIVDTLSNEINGGKRKKLEAKRMPECLFRVPLLEGNCELDEGGIVELLAVKRDPVIRGRYSPATCPLFLSATIVHCDGFVYEVKVVDGKEETTYHVHMSEGLLYPVGTAERLGVNIRGQRTTEPKRYTNEVGGPKKCEEEEWRGFAELLICDEKCPSIRPIVISNIHFGILAEFSFIDSMEIGSLLFPISNPLLLPCQFSKKSKIPVVFDKERVNRGLLEEALNEERRETVAVMTRDGMEDMGMDLSMNGDMKEEDAPVPEEEKSNSVPLDLLDRISHSQILGAGDLFSEELMYELDDMTGAGGEDVDEREGGDADDERELMNPSGENGSCPKEKKKDDDDGLSEKTAQLNLYKDRSVSNIQSLGDENEEEKEKEMEMKKKEDPQEGHHSQEKKKDLKDTEEDKIVGNKRGEVVRRGGVMETEGRNTSVSSKEQERKEKSEEGRAVSDDGVRKVEVMKIVHPQVEILRSEREIKNEFDPYETELTQPTHTPPLRNIKRSLSTTSSTESNRSKKKKMDDISPSSPSSPLSRSSPSPHSPMTQSIGGIDPSAVSLDETGVAVAMDEENETAADAVVGEMGEMVETGGEGALDDASTTAQMDQTHPIPVIPLEEKEGEKNEKEEDGGMNDIPGSISPSRENDNGGDDTGLEHSLAKTSLKGLNISEKTERMVEEKEEEGKDKGREEMGMEQKYLSKSPLKELMKQNEDEEMEEENKDVEGEKMEIEKNGDVETEKNETNKKIPVESLVSQGEEMMETEKNDERKEEEREEREETGLKMLDEGIPSASSNNLAQPGSRDEIVNVEDKEKMASDDEKEEKEDVPCKRSRLGSSMINGVENKEKGDSDNLAGRGVPLDPSFNAFQLPPHQARAVAMRERAKVRGGHPRAPFIRDIPPVNGEVERLIGGDEELQRIQMEQVLIHNNLLRVSDKIIDKDIITVELMSQLRHPLEWNSIEVQLFFDQIDIEQPLRDYLKEQDMDGMKVFRLTLNEIIGEFPNLGEHDFNEKMFLYGFIEKIGKIATDADTNFAPRAQYHH
ncbi:hypothetical protein PENTCL1PPCAC_17632, partial [Pristionchus entomophagus]